MSEDRVRALEVQMTDLRVDNARLSESLDHLSSAVSDLTGVVQEFRDTMNKGKGAIWLFGFGATAIGGIASWVMTRLSQ